LSRLTIQTAGDYYETRLPPGLRDPSSRFAQAQVEAAIEMRGRNDPA
jgi:hypothetical protein